MKIYLAWIALNNDPFSICENGEKIHGPTLQFLLDSPVGRAIDLVCLLYNSMSKNVMEATKSILRSNRIQVREFKLDIQDLSSVRETYCKMMEVVDKLLDEYPDIENEYFININPGPPAAATSFFLMVKSGALKAHIYTTTDRRKASIFGTKPEELPPPVKKMDLDFVIGGRKKVYSLFDLPESDLTQEMRELSRRIVIASETDDPVLILGPRGIGKTRLARKIHERSGREGSFFVATSTLYKDTNMARSQLFGHTRGAFTGADFERKGILELASNGTVFFDEVADMQPEVQGLLLDAIETRSFMPLGSDREVKSNFRAIFATNRTIDEIRKKRLVRLDLLDRISTFTFRLPPIHQWGEKAFTTIIERVFADHIDSTARLSMRLSPIEIASILRPMKLKGNFRTLITIVKRFARFAREGNAEELKEIAREVAREEEAGVDYPDDLDLLTRIEPEDFLNWHEHIKKEYLSALYRRTGGNISSMARALGLERKTLENQLRSFGIHTPKMLSRCTATKEVR